MGRSCETPTPMVWILFSVGLSPSLGYSFKPPHKHHHHGRVKVRVFKTFVDGNSAIQGPLVVTSENDNKWWKRWIGGWVFWKGEAPKGGTPKISAGISSANLHYNTGSLLILYSQMSICLNTMPLKYLTGVPNKSGMVFNKRVTWALTWIRHASTSKPNSYLYITARLPLI